MAITVVQVNKKGRRTVGYVCTNGVVMRLLTGKELLPFVESGECSNASIVYQTNGSKSIRVSKKVPVVAVVDNYQIHDETCITLDTKCSTVIYIIDRGFARKLSKVTIVLGGYAMTEQEKKETIASILSSYMQLNGNTITRNQAYMSILHEMGNNSSYTGGTPGNMVRFSIYSGKETSYGMAQYPIKGQTGEVKVELWLDDNSESSVKGYENSTMFIHSPLIRQAILESVVDAPVQITYSTGLTECKRSNELSDSNRMTAYIDKNIFILQFGAKGVPEKIFVDASRV